MRRMGDELETRSPATRSLSAPLPTLGKIILLGVLFDVAANGQTPGLSAPVFLFLTAVLFWPELVRSREDALFVCSGVAVSIFVAVRAAPVLIALDLMVALCLFALAAIPDRRSMFRSPLISFFRKAGMFLMAGLRAPAFIFLPFRRAASRLRFGRARVWLRAFAVAVPIVLIFGVLLSSADRVFGGIVTPGLPHWSFGSITGHLFFIGFGIIAAGTVARATFGPFASDADIRWPRPELRAAEWISVLASVDVLFALFVVVQFAVLFGGEHRLHVTKGLTYAQYARTGFMQLIVVSALAILVILGAWDLGKRSTRRHARIFLGLTTLTVGLSAVILASALKRLMLYERAFGFTLTRFAATVAIALVAFVLIAVLWAVLAGARDRVVAAILTGAVASLFIVNIVNPDRYVAKHNVGRYETTGKIDVDYLGNALSADAIPVVVPSLSKLAPPDAARLRNELCSRIGSLVRTDDV